MRYIINLLIGIVLLFIGSNACAQTNPKNPNQIQQNQPGNLPMNPQPGAVPGTVPQAPQPGALPNMQPPTLPRLDTSATHPYKNTTSPDTGRINRMPTNPLPPKLK